MNSDSFQIDRKARQVMQNNWEISNGIIYWKGQWQDGVAMVTLGSQPVEVELVASLMGIDFSEVAKYGEQHADLGEQIHPGDPEDTGDGVGESP